MLKSHRWLMAAVVLACLGVLSLGSESAEAKAVKSSLTAGPICCPPPCPPPPIKVCLNVQNPACCTQCTTVEVCIPGCCEGPPKVCSRCGILGRGIVTYEWCCGHRVTVVFTALGTVRVR